MVPYSAQTLRSSRRVHGVACLIWRDVNGRGQVSTQGLGSTLPVKLKQAVVTVSDTVLGLHGRLRFCL
jgi:hypothetical protein